MWPLFKSRAVKVVIAGNCLGFAAALASSLTAAYKFAEFCVGSSDELVDVLSNNITLPEMSMNVSAMGYNVLVQASDVTISLPEDWIEMFRNFSNEAPECFWPALIGTFLLTYIAISAATNTIALILFIKDQQHQPQYQLINAGELTPDGDQAELGRGSPR